MSDELRVDIERFAMGFKLEEAPEVRSVVRRLLDGLEAGDIRAAIPENAGWVAQSWVKQGILLAFRVVEERGLHKA